MKLNLHSVEFELCALDLFIFYLLQCYVKVIEKSLPLKKLLNFTQSFLCVFFIAITIKCLNLF